LSKKYKTPALKGEIKTELSFRVGANKKIKQWQQKKKEPKL
jgi:hypothetical protein